MDKTDFQLKLTCRHCRQELLVPFVQTNHPLTDAAVKAGWENVYYMPYEGNNILLCPDCIVVLKSWMAEFVGAKLSREPRASIQKPGDRVFVRRRLSKLAGDGH